jgi:hypothetical protein
LKYRNIFKFSPGRLFHGLWRRVLNITVTGGVVLALSNRSPLVKKKMRTVITVIIGSVIGVVVVGIGRSIRRR